MIVYAAVLATIVLISPVTSVARERGFSVHNKSRKKGYSSLKHETVKKLMRVKDEVPLWRILILCYQLRNSVKDKKVKYCTLCRYEGRFLCS